MSETAKPLKLMALDAEDLEIISAHCQDAVLRLEDIGYVKKSRRFAIILNRFDWETALKTGKDHQLRRRRSALRFECVDQAEHINLKAKPKDHALKLLTIKFGETNAPSGVLSLIFSGDCEIKLSVECIEVELNDLGAMWETKNLPDHKL